MKEHVKKCIRCEMVRIGRDKTLAQALMKIHQVTLMFKMVAMNCMGLSPSSVGFKKLLVVVDFLARFIVSVLFEKEDAKTVSQALFEKWISIFGLPKKLLREKSGQMVGKVKLMQIYDG